MIFKFCQQKNQIITKSFDIYLILLHFTIKYGTFQPSFLVLFTMQFSVHFTMQFSVHFTMQFSVHFDEQFKQNKKVLTQLTLFKIDINITSHHNNYLEHYRYLQKY